MGELAGQLPQRRGPVGSGLRVGPDLVQDVGGLGRGAGAYGVTDTKARNSGQWGAALRWFAPQLDSEFAAYFINYHSRQPYIGATASPNTSPLGRQE